MLEDQCLTNQVCSWQIIRKSGAGTRGGTTAACGSKRFHSGTRVIHALWRGAAGNGESPMFVARGGISLTGSVKALSHAGKLSQAWKSFRLSPCCLRDSECQRTRLAAQLGSEILHNIMFDFQVHACRVLTVQR